MVSSASLLNAQLWPYSFDGITFGTRATGIGKPIQKQKNAGNSISGVHVRYANNKNKSRYLSDENRIRICIILILNVQANNQFETVRADCYKYPNISNGQC